jgi:hypothetical protein
MGFSWDCRSLLGIAQAPTAFSTVTWTIRQKATGVVRKITALSEQEAGEKTALGLFDEE